MNCIKATNMTSRGARHYTENRFNINYDKTYKNITKGVIPLASTLIQWGFDYKTFANARSDGRQSHITADDLAIRRFGITAASDRDYKTFFGINRPKDEITVKLLRDPVPEKTSVINNVTEMDIPRDENNPFTYSDAVLAFKAKADAKRLSVSAATSTYPNNLRRLLKIIGAVDSKNFRTKQEKEKLKKVDLIAAIMKYPIEVLNKKVEDKVPINNRKDVFGMIETLIKHLPGFEQALISKGYNLNLSKKSRNAFSTQSTKKRDDDSDTKTVTPLNKFLQKADEIHQDDPNSVEDVVAQLFTEIPARRGTDYNKLQIVLDDDDIDEEGNYLDIKTGKMSIAIHKSSKKLGTYKTVIPDKLLKTITSYWKTEKKPKYLFGGDDPLSEKDFNKLFVDTFRSVLPTGEGVKEIRRSTRTYYVRDKKYGLNAQRELAFAMGHGLLTAISYTRQYDDPSFDDEDNVKEVQPKKKRKIVTGMKVGKPKKDEDEEYVPPRRSKRMKNK